MSLHTAAMHLASQGRFGDSMLVHMTPNEVRNFSAFARSIGKEMTINPKTGLPEMNFLDDISGFLGFDGSGKGLFGSKIGKMILPIILGVALGPVGIGMSSLATAATVGAGYWAATGDVKRGIGAGLGAYGGANLSNSFASFAGSGVAESGGPLLVDAAGTGVEAAAGTAAAEAAGPLLVDAAGTGVEAAAGTAAAEAAAASKADLAWQGVKAAADNPGAYYDATSFTKPVAALTASYGLSGDGGSGSGQEGSGAYRINPDPSPVELMQYEYEQDVDNPGVGPYDTGEKRRYTGRFKPSPPITYKPYGG